METADRATRSVSAKNSMQASFARPSTGGAVNATLSTSPSSPTMPLRRAFGCTFTLKRTPSAVCSTRIMLHDNERSAVRDKLVIADRTGTPPHGEGARNFWHQHWQLCYAI